SNLSALFLVRETNLSCLHSLLLALPLALESIIMSDRNSSSGSGSRLRRWLKAPVRMLSRACDCYVRCMTSCAVAVQHGGALGYPTAAPLPRTSSSRDDDLRDLIRASSVSRMGEVLKRPLSQPTVAPRSQSMAMGRIDEDQPCEFEDDVKLGPDHLLSRSRSYAKRRVAAAFR
ncbi:hypothetical protein B296_00027485, partial [Ensete ventricosum]